MIKNCYEFFKILFDNSLIILKRFNWGFFSKKKKKEKIRFVTETLKKPAYKIIFSI